MGTFSGRLYTDSRAGHDVGYVGPLVGQHSVHIGVAGRDAKALTDLLQFVAVSIAQSHQFHLRYALEHLGLMGTPGSASDNRALISGQS